MQTTNPQVQEIWNLIKETRESIKDLRESQKELSVETNKQIQETSEQMKKTDIQLKKFIGDTGNYWGKLGENLVKGNLAKRLREKGIEVEAVVTNAKKGGIEFDIIAINGKETVVVEVKATLDPSDVEKFKKDIEQFKTLWPTFANKTVYGAIAFLLRSNRQAEKLAEKEGFFVISATGDVLIKNKKDFKPKVFS